MLMLKNKKNKEMHRKYLAKRTSSDIYQKIKKMNW